MASHVWNVLNRSNSGQKGPLLCFKGITFFFCPPHGKPLTLFSLRGPCVYGPLAACLPYCHGVTVADSSKDSASPRGSRSMAIPLPGTWG